MDYFYWRSAAVLIETGGLSSLQTAVLIAALPFSVVMLLICYSLVKGFYEERMKMQVKTIPPTPSASGRNISWRDRLSAITSFPEKREAQRFLFGVVLVALRKIRAELVDSQVLMPK